MKFEYLFAVLILGVLTAALFYFSDNEKITIAIVTVLTSAMTGVVTFLYTKHQTPKNGESTDAK